MCSCVSFILYYWFSIASCEALRMYMDLLSKYHFARLIDILCHVCFYSTVSALTTAIWQDAQHIWHRFKSLCDLHFWSQYRVLLVFSTDLPLTQRIEYLSRAIMCAKSATSLGGSTASGEFLHELEEKMEVRVHAEPEETTGNILWRRGWGGGGGGAQYL